MLERVDDKQLTGELHIVTVSKDFEVFVTPERSTTVTMPSSMAVLRVHVRLADGQRAQVGSRFAVGCITVRCGTILY